MAASNILETFLILFQTNADDVEEGNKKVKTSTEKLQEELDKTDVKTQAVGKQFVALSSRLWAAAAAFVSVGAIAASALANARFANDLYDLSESLGVNIETLSAWGDAVKTTGGSAEALHGTLESMAEDFAQMATTGRSRLLPFFNELGIKVLDSKGKVRGVLDVLPELADSFSKLSKQEALGLGKKLGLDRGTIMLLQQGRREVDAVIQRQRELGAVTERQALAAKAWNDTLQDTAHAYRTLSLEIGTAVLPSLTWLLQRVQDVVRFMLEHKELVVGFFIALGGAVTAYALPALVRLAIAMAAALAPFYLAVLVVGALATGFALLFEDIMVLAAGGDSLIGRVYDWLKGFKEFLAVLNLVKVAIAALGEAWDKIKGPLAAFAKAAFSPAKLELSKAQEQISFAAGSPLASSTSGAITAGATNRTSNQSIHVDNINLATQATDAAGIAGALGGHMTQQFRQAQQNFDDGIDA